MPFATGMVYFFKGCQASNPVKDKLAICMSAEASLFYLINSVDEKRPYQYEKDHVVYLEKYQIKCLSHTSYINVSKICFMTEKSFTEQVVKELLPNAVWLLIKQKVLSDRLVLRKYKDIILHTEKLMKF